MKDNKDNLDKERDFTKETFNRNSIASANEFTGLISAGIESKDEAETYSEEFNITQQKQIKAYKGKKKK